MKCKIPEISWHNRDPVLSVDIQAKNDRSDCVHRLASAGTDAHVLIWCVKLTSNDIELDLVADLTRHQRAVNVVRWSPNGEMLASGDDESVIIIWKQKSDLEPLNVLDNNNEQDKEIWLTLKVLRGHMEDVYDLSWSPDSLYLVSGSVDNSAMIWDVQKGKSMAILSEHKGFVQGVAWDPKNQYIATLSTDRYLRIFDTQTKKILYRLNKSNLPFPDDHALNGKRMRIFHDDTLQTFFRRLSFTPDGKLLLTPAGCTDSESVIEPLHTTYAFSRYNFRQPVIVLPCSNQYTVVVRCCPLLYRLRPFNSKKNPPIISLPYRMIFAVATRSSVYFYDTQQKPPFALISNIHYTRLTDITWSSDGRIVVVSSTDGFCSLITFEEGELGEIYEPSEAVLAQDLITNKKKKPKRQKDNEIHTLKSPSVCNNENQQMMGEMQDDISEKVTRNKEEDKGNETELRKHEQQEIAEKVKEDSDEITQARRDEVTDGKEVTKIIKTPDRNMKDKRKQKAKSQIDSVNDKTVKTKSDLEKEVEQKCIIYDKKNNQKQTLKANAEDVNVQGIENNASSCQVKSQLTETETETETWVQKGQRSATASGNVETLEKEFVTIKGLKKETNVNENHRNIMTIVPLDMILDKEIISSDKKFESPEKKCRPVTPIASRKHPRKVIDSPNSLSKDLPSSSTSIAIKKNHRKWEAKPIAIRRTPRTTSTVLLAEEALDAWPLTKKSTTCDDSKIENTDGNCVSADPSTKETKQELLVIPPVLNDTICERTEDIRLVYEDTVEEEQPEKN